MEVPGEWNVSQLVLELARYAPLAIFCYVSKEVETVNSN